MFVDMKILLLASDFVYFHFRRDGTLLSVDVSGGVEFHVETKLRCLVA